MQWVCPTCRDMVQRTYQREHLLTHINTEEAEAALVAMYADSDEFSSFSSWFNSTLESGLVGAEIIGRTPQLNTTNIAPPAELVRQYPPTTPSIPTQSSQPLHTTLPQVHTPTVTTSHPPSTVNPASLSSVTRRPPSRRPRQPKISSLSSYSYQYNSSFA